MANEFDNRFEVYHAGDEKLGIKGTGQKRLMSEEQFELLKGKGWAKVPDTGVPVKETETETGNNDSDNTDNGGVEKSTDVLVPEAIAHIKALGEAGQIEEIKKYAEGDERKSVIHAVEYYLEPETDNSEE
jgi:hypothetical protein